MSATPLPPAETDGCSCRTEGAACRANAGATYDRWQARRAVWESAETIEDLHQIRPGDGTPPSERTIVYVLYDKDALYVAARMWDSGAPNEITRNIMKQGSTLAEDDRLAIVLDPFNSRRQGTGSR